MEIKNIKNKVLPVASMVLKANFLGAKFAKPNVLFVPFSVHSFTFSRFPIYQGLVYRYRCDLINRKQWKKRRSGGEVTYTAFGNAE
jgi:hypothetical protein